jgi:hypothetical protein
MNKKKTLFLPLGKASAIVKPYQLYDYPRHCADVNFPYKRNVELTQSALHVNHCF